MLFQGELQLFRARARIDFALNDNGGLHLLEAEEGQRLSRIYYPRGHDELRMMLIYKSIHENGAWGDFEGRKAWLARFNPGRRNHYSYVMNGKKEWIDAL